jgi:hypothetical protein
MPTHIRWHAAGDDLRRKELQPPRRPIENELYRAIPQSHVGPKAAAGIGTKSREEIGHVVGLDCGRDRARVRPSQGGLLYSAKRSDAKRIPFAERAA